MSTSWRQPAAEDSDSEEDVIFMGPVTERELEISRLLNETICLPDGDASDSTSDTLAGLESGFRAVTLEGTRESRTMNELELPASAVPGVGGSPVTDSHLDESAAPLASGENTASSRQWEELPSELPLSSTRLTEESRVWEELPSETPLPEESRVWEELPSENPLPGQLTAVTEESRVWEEMPSENPLPAAPAEEGRIWEEIPSENPLPAAPAEESRVWEKMPSENPLPAAPAEESRVWEEMPSENPLSAAPAEESRVWEEMPSENPLPAAPAEESRVWEEMPSENPLPAAPAEETRVWEELPSEYPLSVPVAAADATAAEESLCDDLSAETDPAMDQSHWLTLASDEEDPEPGNSAGERRETPGALIGALSDELAAPASTGDSPRRGTPRASITASRASATGASPRATQTVPPRSPSSLSPEGGGLLQAMHHHLSSPGAASVESYHTCYGGGVGDDSRRLTGASGLSDISLMPAAPPNSTLGVGEDSSEDDSRLYESSVEEPVQQQQQQKQQQQQRLMNIPLVCISEASHESSGPLEDTNSDNGSQSPSLGGRDRITSLASESSLAGSCVSSTGSELNDTLEMMEKLLAMEAEERRLESILQSRTAAGETVLLDSQGAADDTDHPRDDGGHGALAEGHQGHEGHAAPAEGHTAMAAVTPSRSAATPSTVGGKPKTTPVPAPTPRGRGRPSPAATAGLTPRQQQLSAKSPARLGTPRARVTPSPARSAASVAASRLKTPTSAKTATVAPQTAAPRTRPNLKDIVSPVARYIHDGPEPTLVQNLRPKTRTLNSVIPQARPTPQKLAPLAEESAVPPPSQETAQGTGKVLKDLNISTASNTSNTSSVSANSSASAGSRIPVKVPSRPAVGQENRRPLPKVSYKTSGNLVMDREAWNKLVRKNTAENRKLGRFLASPSPVLAVKHTGHKSVSSRRVRWNDEFAVPDMAVRVRPMRRSVSDLDLTQTSDASFMEVSVCEVRSARPTAVRH